MSDIDSARDDYRAARLMHPAAPTGPLPPLTTAGTRRLCRNMPKTLDDCIAAGSGTPGTMPTEAELDAWAIPVAACK